MNNKIIVLSLFIIISSLFLDTCAYSQQYIVKMKLTENDTTVTEHQISHSRTDNNYFPIESKLPAGNKYLILFSQQNGYERAIDTLDFYPADSDSLGFQVQHNQLYVYQRLYRRLHDNPTGNKTDRFSLVFNQYDIGEDGIDFNRRLLLESDQYPNLEQSSISFTDRFAIVKTLAESVYIDLSTMTIIKNGK